MSLPGSRRAARAGRAAATRSRCAPARRSSRCSTPGITARQILTRQAFENAIAVVMALGGSTNAVLHLLAIAHEAEVELSLDDFNRIGDTVPHLADVKPFGRYVMTDVDRIGGVPVVMRALLDAGLLHGDALTVTGRTLGREPRRARRRPTRTARSSTRWQARSTAPAGIAILRGSLAPDGAVVKSAGFDADVFEGAARVFDGEEAAMDGGHRRAGQGRRRRRDPLRGPQGRAGHARDARRHRRDQGRRARQGRAAAHRRPVLRRHTGLCVGHVAPEAADGGPIALVADGDRIRLDMANRHARPAGRRRRAATAAGPAGAAAAAVHDRRAGASTPSSSAPPPAAPSAAEPCAPASTCEKCVTRQTAVTLSRVRRRARVPVARPTSCAKLLASIATSRRPPASTLPRRTAPPWPRLVEPVPPRRGTMPGGCSATWPTRRAGAAERSPARPRQRGTLAGAPRRRSAGDDLVDWSTPGTGQLARPGTPSSSARGRRLRADRGPVADAH